MTTAQSIDPAWSAFLEYERLLDEFEAAATRAQQVHIMDPESAAALEQGLKSVISQEIVRCRKAMRASGWPGLPSLRSELSHLYDLDECGFCGKLIEGVYMGYSCAGLTSLMMSPCGHLAWLLTEDQLQDWWAADEAEIREIVVRRHKAGRIGDGMSDADREELHRSSLARFKALRSEVSRFHRIRWGGMDEHTTSASAKVTRLNSADLAKRERRSQENHINHDVGREDAPA